jgi:hypothetical protein
MPFAVNAVEVATPLAFVVAVFTAPANVPLAPVCAGTANVTIAPGSGFPALSFTVAFKVDAKAVPIKVLCGVPPVAAIEFTELAALTVILSDFVAVSVLASVTLAAKVLVPVPVGVPEITPVVEASASPVGKVPEVTDQL